MPAALFLVSIIALLPASGWQVESQPGADAIEQIAVRILQYQAEDGAIAMDPIAPSRTTRVVPYVGNYGAMGLVAAYHATHRTAFRVAALRWVHWYEAHMNSDGTIDDWMGSPTEWKSTHNRDSTDAYAATYLCLLERLYRAKNDETWLRERKPFIRKAMDAIRLTLQPCGLTTAKPDWPVMYTMDNVETALGLRSTAFLAAQAGWRDLQHEAGDLARAMEEAIYARLWDAPSSTFLVGLQTDGAKIRAGSEWYPSVMANLMATAWLPRSSRTTQLFQRLYQQYGATTLSTDDPLHLVWWCYAARTCGSNQLKQALLNRLEQLSRHLAVGCYPDALGHICVLLASRSTANRASDDIPSGRELP